MATTTSKPGRNQDGPVDGLENGVQEDEYEEPNFDDPESYIDNIADEELLKDINQQKPKESDVANTAIVIDGLPLVGPDKFPKLEKAIKKTLTGYGFGEYTLAHYPLDDNGFTKGYLFLCYGTAEIADDAVVALNGYKMDKTHVFEINRLCDFENYVNIKEDWDEPIERPYADSGNLRSWLLDENASDQYSVIYEAGDKVAIFKNNLSDPEMLDKRERWTDSIIQWSPRGTFLATVHSRGIVLWGGDNFSKLHRFDHPLAQFVDFSPCENYLVTFNPPRLGSFNTDSAPMVIMWHIFSGVKKRCFKMEANIESWPIFKWSFNGHYFSWISEEGRLSVYETSTFGLLDKKSLEIPEICEFDWSPSANLIAYWVPQIKEVPAKVCLLEIPSRTDLRSKKLFDVEGCKLYWHPQGTYLCCRVGRYASSKTKKKLASTFNLELFRMQDKGIPIDTVELKEDVKCFAWEPTGRKFAVLHGENPKFMVSFYEMSVDKVVLSKTLERRNLSDIVWSPRGQFVVLAGLKGNTMGGVLDFVDTSDTSNITIINSMEHFMASGVDWDPTGRYLVSSVSYWHHKVDNSYWLWSFQGKLIQRNTLDKFCQLLWRPRPASLLSEDDMKQIKKDMKKYKEDFEAKDKMSQSKASKELIEKRRELMSDFRQWRLKLETNWKHQFLRRKELRNGVIDEMNANGDDEDEDEDNFEEETVEILVKEEVSIYRTCDE